MVLERQYGTVAGEAVSPKPCRVHAKGDPHDEPTFCSVHRDPADAALVARVGEVLRGMRRLWPDYVERVMTAEEARCEEGLAGAFSFVLEGTEGTLFHNSLTEPLLQHASEEGYALYRGMHGHSPDKGPKPPVIFIGPDVVAGMRMDSADMLDVCPTLAQLLGVSMPDMEGQPLPVMKGIA